MGTQLRRPRLTIPISGLHPRQLHIVADLTDSPACRQRVRDVEERRERLLQRETCAGQQIPRALQIAGVLGAELALADGKQRRRSYGAGSGGIRDGGNRAKRVVFFVSIKETVSAAGSHERIG